MKYPIFIYHVNLKYYYKVTELYGEHVKITELTSGYSFDSRKSRVENDLKERRILLISPAMKILLDIK